jgi:hypothetical protein
MTGTRVCGGVGGRKTEKVMEQAQEEDVWVYLLVTPPKDLLERTRVAMAGAEDVCTDPM